MKKQKLFSFKIFAVINLLLFQSNIGYTQWQQTNGPFYPTVNCLGASGSDLYAGTVHGFYKSVNNGNSWVETSNGNLVNSRAFATVGSNLFVADIYSDIYKSTNNAATWNNLGVSFTTNQIYDLNASGGNLFAATSGDGVFLSSDSGATWTAVNAGLTNLNISSVTANGSTIFCGSGAGLFVSTTNGASWSFVNTGFPNAGVICLASSGSDIYAGTTAGVFISNNNGSTWSLFNNGISYFPIQCITANGAIAYAGTYTNGLFVSVNNGVSWSDVSTPQNRMNVHAITISNSNAIAGTDGGAYLTSNNGITWNGVNNGFHSNAIFHMASIGTHIFTMADAGGVYSTSDGGNTWQFNSVNYGLSPIGLSGIAVNDSIIYAGGYGGIYASVDSGNTWNRIDSAFSMGITCFGFKGDTMFIGASGFSSKEIQMSTNHGYTWTVINNGIPTNNYIQSILFMGDTLFVSTGGNGIFYSTNNGTSWATANSGIGSMNVLALQNDGSTLYASTTANVYTSINHGMSWQPTTLIGAFNMIVRNGIVFANNASGVHFTTDHGITWINTYVGLPLFDFFSFSISNMDLYVGTSTKAVWRRDVSQIIGVQEQESQQNHFSIYPNPSLGKITIRMDGTFNIPIQFHLTNTIGKEVVHKTIYDNKTEIEINQAAGIYFMTLQNSNQRLTQKIILY